MFEHVVYVWMFETKANSACLQIWLMDFVWIVELITILLGLQQCFGPQQRNNTTTKHSNTTINNNKNTTTKQHNEQGTTTHKNTNLPKLHKQNKQQTHRTQIKSSKTQTDKRTQKTNKLTLSKHNSNNDKHNTTKHKQHPN